MRHIKSMFFILILSITAAAGNAYAQESGDLTLRLRRDFGYGGGVDIQGSFSLLVTGPDDLVRIEYYIDGELLGESSEPTSFRYKFSTDDYPLGQHTLSALGFTSSGEQLTSNTITKNFVSATEGYQSALKIVGIIIALLIGVSALSYLVTRLVGGKKKSGEEVPLGEPRSYGLLGGTICPKCGRPFSRHIWGLNMGVGKFDRCSHCGKWSMTYRATPSELRAAELAELELVEGADIETPTTSEEERLRKDLEDSRYNDL